MMPAILTSASYYFIAVLLSWLILYLFFAKVFNLSQKQWKLLEFIWIFVGLLGVASILNDNKRDFSEYERDNCKRNIQNSISIVKSDLNIYFSGKPYIRTEYSPANLADINEDQKVFSKWSNGYKILIDSITVQSPILHLPRIDPKMLGIRTDSYDRNIQEFNNTIKDINFNIDTYNILSEELKSNFWLEFQRTFGILFILIAFAIRLSIATKNYLDAKGNEFISAIKEKR